MAEKPPVLMPPSVLKSTTSCWCKEMRRGGGSAPQNLPEAESAPGQGALAHPGCSRGPPSELVPRGRPEGIGHMAFTAWEKDTHIRLAKS